ncbi:MAG TPA: GNAT family N-acetyltransferase, partial [Lachnoclostridium sp.]|nr:GNAT family N-acetyltransferase [Lachnoclostridium sp.]
TFRMYQLNFDEKDEKTYMEYWDKYADHFVEQNI